MGDVGSLAEVVPVVVLGGAEISLIGGLLP